MNKKEQLLAFLDELFPDARCELNYHTDYELLIATMLSAQTTDKRVNMVTSVIWEKYKNLEGLATASVIDLEAIIRPLGSFRRKAEYTKEIAVKLLNEYNGIVPKTHEELESFPGVGRKVANVVLSNIYDIPSIAVDTHVARVSKRLGYAKETDSVLTIEKKLMKAFPKDKWSRLHHQLVLFGRYHCKASKPECESCHLKEICPYFKKEQAKKVHPVR